MTDGSSRARLNKLAVRMVCYCDVTVSELFDLHVFSASQPGQWPPDPVELDGSGRPDNVSGHMAVITVAWLPSGAVGG